MKTFTTAYSEYIKWLIKLENKPRLVYWRDKYMVTLFYSDETLTKIGAEIIA